MLTVVQMGLMSLNRSWGRPNRIRSGMGVNGDQDAGTDDGTGEDPKEDDLDELLGDDGGDDSADGADDEDESDDDASSDVDAIVDALESRLGARFDSIADRRVNALLKEIRKQGGGDEEPSAPKSRREPAVTGGEVRAVRAAAREYLSDEVKFRGAEERAFAMDLVGTLAASHVGDIDDEDAVGREIAGQVATRVTDLRKMYERQTVAALRKKGALVERPGQPQKQGGNGTSQTSEMSKGAEIAARIRPVNQN